MEHALAPGSIPGGCILSRIRKRLLHVFNSKLLVERGCIDFLGKPGNIPSPCFLLSESFDTVVVLGMKITDTKHLGEWGTGVLRVYQQYFRDRIHAALSSRDFYPRAPSHIYNSFILSPSSTCHLL